MSEVAPYKLTRSDLNKLGCNKESTPEKAYGVTRYDWKGFQVKSALGLSTTSIYIDTEVRDNFIKMEIYLFCSVNDDGRTERIFEACLRRILPEVGKEKNYGILMMPYWEILNLPLTEENVYKAVEIRNKIVKFVKHGIDKKSEVCLVD